MMARTPSAPPPSRGRRRPFRHQRPKINGAMIIDQAEKSWLKGRTYSAHAGFTLLIGAERNPRANQ
jgi:hypothetical protein